MEQKKQRKYSFETAEHRVRSSLEEHWLGIPSLTVLGESKKMPALIDTASYGREFTVKDGGVYTVRMGLHRDPEVTGGAIPGDSVAECMLSSAMEKHNHILAIFAFPEIYPYVIQDMIVLTSDHPFYVKPIYNSAALENSSGTSRLPLGEHAIRKSDKTDDVIFIGHDQLKGVIPDYCSYSYDLLTFQIWVSFDTEQIVEE